jgi:hypothetical protein
VINYEFFERGPRLFNDIFGFNLYELEALISTVEREFNKQITSKYKRPERFHKLDIRSMVMIPLMYYRHYVTQRFRGALFGLDGASVCRIIKKFEPILSQIMKLPERTGLRLDELESLIIDATKNSIERHNRNQKAYYSGKKKRHTVKTEIRITRGGRIIGVSKSVSGSVYDFSLLKQRDEILQGARVYVDSGYQGIQHIHREAEYPYKKQGKRERSEEEKEYNMVLSRIRVKNVLAKIKVFKILSDKYWRGRFRFKIIAGMVNLKSGFGFA